jgi:thioredoxin
MSNPAITAINEAEFDAAVRDATTPLIVDFYADWCGPCKTQAPILEAFARERTADVTVLKVDVDQNSALAGRFAVRSIPTLVLFDGGEPVASRVGAQSAKALAELLSEAQPAAATHNNV